LAIQTTRLNVNLGALEIPEKAINYPKCNYLDIRDHFSRENVGIEIVTFQHTSLFKLHPIRPNYSLKHAKGPFSSSARTISWGGKSNTKESIALKIDPELQNSSLITIFGNGCRLWRAGLLVKVIIHH
jgi:hypothetical protein